MFRSRGAGRLRSVTVPGPATALPVLDIGPYLADPSAAAGREFVADLGRTVHEIGFLYLVGHGIPDDLGTRVHDVARRFFALPDADRLAIENVRSAQFRGYTRFGHERTNGRVDLRDQIDIGRELPPPALGPTDPAWLRLRGPNLWPDALPELRPARHGVDGAPRSAGPDAARRPRPRPGAGAGHVHRRRLAARGAAQGHPLRDAARRRHRPPGCRQPPRHRVPVVRPPGRRGRPAGRARRPPDRRRADPGRPRRQHRRDVPARHAGLLPGHRAPRGQPAARHRADLARLLLQPPPGGDARARRAAGAPRRARRRVATATTPTTRSSPTTGTTR